MEFKYGDIVDLTMRDTSVIENYKVLNVNGRWIQVEGKIGNGEHWINLDYVIFVKIY